MKDSRFDKLILRDLFLSSEGLLTFTLFRRFQMRPSQVFYFIEKYSKSGIIKFENEKITLTEKGREEIVVNGISIAKNKNNFTKIPVQFMVSNLEINEFYIPKLSGTRSIFKKNNGAE